MRVCVFSSIIHQHNILLCSDFRLPRLVSFHFSNRHFHQLRSIIAFALRNQETKEKEGDFIDGEKQFTFLLNFFFFEKKDGSSCCCMCCCSMVILFLSLSLFYIIFSFFFYFFSLLTSWCIRYFAFAFVSFSHWPEILSLLLSIKKIKNEKKTTHASLETYR